MKDRFLRQFWEEREIFPIHLEASAHMRFRLISGGLARQTHRMNLPPRMIFFFFFLTNVGGRDLLRDSAGLPARILPGKGGFQEQDKIKTPQQEEATPE